MLFVNFFKGLFDENGSVSSKRFAGIEVLQVIIVMVLGSQFTKYKLDYAVLISLLSFVIACFGLNAMLQSKSMTVKKDVASDIVNKTSDNESAANVLQADKPSA